VFIVVCPIVSWYIIAGITVSGQRAFGISAETSFSDVSLPIPLYNRSSGQVWLLGGLSSTDFSNDVWTSTNMLQWSRSNSSTNRFTPRYGGVTGIDSHQIMYLAAGFQRRTLNDVWTSTDGDAWTMVCSHAPFPNRYLAQMSIVSSPLLGKDILTIIGGLQWESSTALADVWISSDDALSWIRITAIGPFSARFGAIMDVSGTNTIVLANGVIGRLQNFTNELWVSYDGAMTWSIDITAHQLQRTYLLVQSN
jgi:hypothetical protein